MSEAIEYASPPTPSPRTLVDRATIFPFYYLGWTIGSGIPGYCTGCPAVDAPALSRI